MTGSGGKTGRRRVALFSQVTTTSALNEPVVSYQSAGSLWMEARDVSAREKYRSDEIQARVDTRFKVRYSTAAAAILPTHQLELDGKRYSITGIRESQVRRWIEIDAAARNDG